MSIHGSITHYLAAVKDGDRDALQGLWERYCQRLVGLARKRLREAPRRAADEEDVVLCAFDSFCRGAEQGRFPRLEDRDDVWKVLVMLTARKAADLAQHERRHKRGGGKVRGESALGGPDEGPGLGEILSQEPTPELAAIMAEECERLLAALDDEELRQIAVWKLEGYTNEEIAARLNCVGRTVRRKLELIQNIWAGEAPEVADA